jgi:carboxylesterase type B
VPLRPTRETGSHSDEEVFLSGKPEELIASGKFHNVPYITGVTSREANIYVQGEPYCSLYNRSDLERSEHLCAR